MASEKSYSITLSNNRTEKAAIDYVMRADPSFLNPSRESRKCILDILGLPQTFARAFDLIQVPGYINSESEITVADADSITLVELKTTRKHLPDCPKGFFFGATQNEFDLAKRMGDQYRFCFVCLHQDSMGYHLLRLKDLEAMIRTKRTQYQINL
ncbi:MAG: hypothetical protein U1F44_04340 [Coriobacteriia bacterium]|nr:hypothetical protein [Coriobacteriia bacterium]